MFENVPVEDLAATLGEHDFGTPDAVREGDRIDAIESYEKVIRHCQAKLAEHTAAHYEDQRRRCNDDRRLDGTFVDEGTIAKSVIADVAMARQMSPTGEETHFAFSLMLSRMPATAALLAGGWIAERVARAVVAECAGLDPAAARGVDTLLAPDLTQMTAKTAAAAARKYAIEFDPDAAEERATTERADRYVAARPGPNATGLLNAKMPAERVQECWKALDAVAQAARADGDGRTFGQLMADTLYERVTGRSVADDIGVEVGLVMEPGALLAGDEVPAMLEGHGPIPPGIARHLATGSRTWLRRLFTDPIDGTVFARDPRRRRFDGSLGALIRAAEQSCRQPWCDAPVRDIDHRTPYEHGGITAWGNGDGYCKRSHTTRHLPGWKVDSDDGGKTLTWTTPTGRTYTSHRKPALGHVSRAAHTRLQRLVATGRLGPGHQRQ